ncbi:MAG TPA: VIT1/CCC1 transporter family protein [Sphingomicrobium sp.]|nr:VIT1/CCC1 transporter family protein [Sphingomicrobium sp.]
MLRRLVDRYLDPSESLLEILFGLVMALTMTAGARLVADPATLKSGELIAALAGCNVAWGFIDAVFYLVGSIFNRNRRLELVRRLQATTEEGEAIALIRDEFGLQREPRMRDEDRAVFYRSMLAMLRHADTRRASLTPGEFAAAAIIFALVSLTAVPGLIPLAVMSDVGMALRLANGLQVMLLFYVGYKWSHYSGSNPWRGAAMIGVMGIVLVLVSVALGG